MAKREGISVKKRFEILTRDHFACQYCGRPAPQVPLVVDHCIPVAEGGTNEDFNLVTACQECNQGKSAMILSRLEYREAFHSLYQKAVSTLATDFVREVPEIKEFLHEFFEGTFAEVRHWCEPDLRFLCAAIQCLLDAGNGKDFSVFAAMGMPSDEPDSLRLMGALLVWCLGPAPALIPAALSGHKVSDTETIKRFIDGWLDETAPIRQWTQERNASEQIQ